MDDTKTKIYKTLHILENEKEKFSDTKFLTFCKIVKRDVLKAFEEGILTKDETKPLLVRVNNLLELSQNYKKEVEREKPITQKYKESTKIKICPKCSAQVRARANFCKKCGYSFK